MTFFELSDKNEKNENIKEELPISKRFKKGKFYIGEQIIIYILKNKEEINSFGIAISKKMCHAVQRNWIKRKIRENYRLLQNKLKQGHDIGFLME